MVRNPSLHITEDKLLLVLKELVNSKTIKVNTTYEKLAYQIFSLSRPYSIINRSINITNDRVDKKVCKLLSSSRLDSSIFANLLHLVRRQLKHKGIAPIRAGSKDWDSLKVITSQAIDFCNEFNLEKKEGFHKYIELGLKKMKKFGLVKFNNMYSGICETYQAELELAKDSDPDGTNALYKYYVGHIARKTGVVNEYDSPDKYLCFMKVREEANRLGVDGVDYIKAQFYGLDFTGGIPDPLQLIGEKAIDRLNKYLFKFNIKTDDGFKLDIDKIKKA